MICQGHRKIDNNSARRLAESAELHIACSGRVQCSSVPSAVSIHGGILGQMACFPGGLTCVYREMHCVASLVAVLLWLVTAPHGSIGARCAKSAQA